MSALGHKRKFGARRMSALLAAQPKSEPDALAKIHPEARAARAEAPPESKRVTQSIDHEQNHYRENQSFDRFSIKGQ